MPEGQKSELQLRYDKALPLLEEYSSCWLFAIWAEGFFSIMTASEGMSDDEQHELLDALLKKTKGPSLVLPEGTTLFEDLARRLEKTLDGALWLLVEGIRGDNGDIVDHHSAGNIC